MEFEMKRVKRWECEIVEDANEVKKFALHAIESTEGAKEAVASYHLNTTFEQSRGCAPSLTTRCHHSQDIATFIQSMLMLNQ
jgi:hypothetical protein